MKLIPTIALLLPVMVCGDVYPSPNTPEAPTVSLCVLKHSGKFILQVRDGKTFLLFIAKTCDTLEPVVWGILLGEDDIMQPAPKTTNKEHNI